MATAVVFRRVPQVTVVVQRPKSGVWWPQLGWRDVTGYPGLVGWRVDDRGSGTVRGVGNTRHLRLRRDVVKASLRGVRTATESYCDYSSN